MYHGQGPSFGAPEPDTTSQSQGQTLESSVLGFGTILAQLGGLQIPFIETTSEHHLLPCAQPRTPGIFCPVLSLPYPSSERLPQLTISRLRLPAPANRVYFFLIIKNSWGIDPRARPAGSWVATRVAFHWQFQKVRDS